MRFERYKEVEPSWLKEVPSHWDVRRIASVFEQRKERNKPIKTEEILSLSAKYGVSLYSERKEKGGNKPKEDISNYNICHEGDILVNCMNIVAGSVGMSQYYGAISPVYYALKIIDNNSDKRYMEYVFRNYNFQRSLVGTGKGIQMSESDDGRLFTVRMRIAYDSLKVQNVPIPPLQEQEQIANFLDWKINEIDRLIKKEKEKLSMLVSIEQKIIDEHFYSIKDKCKRVRLGMLGKFDKGGGFSRENLIKDETENYAILYGDIYTKYKYSFYNCINKIDELAFDQAKKVDSDILLFTASGETKEDIGKCILYTGSKPIALGGDVISLRLDESVYPKYIMYNMNTSEALEFKYINSKGDIIVHIYPSSLKDFEVCVPSLPEQKLITGRIDSKLNDLKKQRELIAMTINELGMLKQSLISEVVTGKIDIRNIDIPEYEKVESVFEEDEDQVEGGKDEWD